LSRVQDMIGTVPLSNTQFREGYGHSKTRRLRIGGVPIEVRQHGSNLGGGDYSHQSPLSSLVFDDVVMSRHVELMSGFVLLFYYSIRVIPTVLYSTLPRHFHTHLTIIIQLKPIIDRQISIIYHKIPEQRPLVRNQHYLYCRGVVAGASEHRSLTHALSCCVYNSFIFVCCVYKSYYVRYPRLKTNSSDIMGFLPRIFGALRALDRSSCRA
jgi:hypothetical protein